MKFGHVGISVSHLARSVAFYRKYFGLVCQKKYEYPDKGMTIALLKKGNIALELFEFKKYKSLPKYRRKLGEDLKTLGVKHFSLETNSIENLYKKFKKAKVRFETNLRVFDSGARYFFMKDPDGILIEVMETL